MSRSAQDIKNPATHFLQWKGSDGTVNYWDKASESNINVPLPLTFLVLDDLTAITGWSDADNSSIWSNEVKNAKDELTVRTKKGIIARGAYTDIKDKVKAAGGKYAKSVYIAAYNDEKELEIQNFRFNGAALTSWIELTNKFDVYAAAIAITGSEEAKKGATTYYTPVFETKAVSPSTDDQAKQLDKELQAYLKTYFDRYGDSDQYTTATEDEPEEITVEDVQRNITLAGEKHNGGTIDLDDIETADSRKKNDIDLSELPF